MAEGKFDDQFPIDVFQTGSGTSSNMNANEVIANRAIELTGGDRFAAKKPIHPNDHVNMGQITNDMFPTAIHVAVAVAIKQRADCRRWSDSKTRSPKSRGRGTRSSRSAARIWPTPRRCGWARSSAALPGNCELSIERAERAIAGRARIARRRHGRRHRASTPIPSSAAAWPRCWPQETGIPFVEAVNHFEANAQRDGLVECRGQLRAIAVTLFNVANNIRWLGSGPRCGFYEIMLPDRQPGSSIMPGKVNPVMCESMMQVCARVMGNDQTIAFCGATGGQFQLNIMMPVMGHATLESVQLLAARPRPSSISAPSRWKPTPRPAKRRSKKACRWSPASTRYIGYERAAALAKEAFKTGKNDPRTLPRAKDPARRAARQSPRSLEHDRAAEVVHSSRSVVRTRHADGVITAESDDHTTSATNNRF